MEDVAGEYARRVRAQLGTRVKEIRLFGSRARGDAREHSDYDVLIILEQRDPKLRAEILEIAARMMDQYGVLVATVLRSAEEWHRSQGYPFARNIVRESVAL